MPKFYQDDDDMLYRAFDWQNWLAEEEAILTADVHCDDDMIIIDQVTIDGSLVKYRVKGGTAGKAYTISCQITTSAGETIERSINLIVNRM
jgi:hypothetical protein